MSHQSIPKDIRRNIIYKSGGRCQSCNKNLAVNGLTQLENNEGEFAHIIAVSPDGPRGDHAQSVFSATEESNIMLLCQSCHKLFDNSKYFGFDNAFALPTHEVDALIAMKVEQEKNVQHLLDTLDKPRTHIIKYTTRIHTDAIPPCSDIELNRTLVIDGLFPAPGIIDLSHRNIHGDDDAQYWADEIRQLEGSFASRIKPHVDSGDIKQIAVFAFAPIPLLIKLGTLLRDYANIFVYQRKKEPASWNWEPDPAGYKFKISEPENSSDIIAINLSLSADINNERIYQVLGEGVSVWKLHHDAPGNDFIRSKQQLKCLRKTFREMYQKVSARHGNIKPLHIFPAMPISAAVEFGRVRNSKADNPLKIYDENKNKGDGFECILDIN